MFNNYDMTIRSYLSKTFANLGLQYTHSQIFGVILADAWNETKIKNNIITSYREKSFIGKYLATERIKNPIYDVREFNQSKTLEKYKLLSLAWELI